MFQAPTSLLPLYYFKFLYRFQFFCMLHLCCTEIDFRDLGIRVLFLYRLRFICMLLDFCTEIDFRDLGIRDSVQLL